MDADCPIDEDYKNLSKLFKYTRIMH